MPIEIDLAGQAWRIDAAPADVEALVRQLLSAALEQNPANEREIDNRRRAQSARLWQRLRELRVVGPDESITLDALLRSIQSEVSADIANALTPRTLWTTPPYSTLGGIPIATSDAEAAAISAPRVRDFFPAIEGGRAEASYPIFGAEPAGGGNTWWMHYSNSWWTALLVTQYRAHTSTTADGWEAADLAGGMYATAKTACQQLQVPASGDPDYRFVIALIKAASCQYAKTAPEVAWPSYRIETIVCSCFAKSVSGGCAIYDGEELSSDCSRKEGFWTTEVNDTKTLSIFQGPICCGVVSSHTAEVVKGVGITRWLGCGS